MSIREFLDALRSTQGQHTLASVLEGPESGVRLLLCEGVPVWPARPEGLLARNLPALAGCGASGILTLENKRIFVEKFGGAPRLVICGGGHVAESVVRLAVMLGLPVTGLEERPDYADALRRAGAERWSRGQEPFPVPCRHPAHSAARAGNLPSADGHFSSQRSPRGWIVRFPALSVP